MLKRSKSISGDIVCLCLAFLFKKEMRFQSFFSFYLDAMCRLYFYVVSPLDPLAAECVSVCERESLKGVLHIVDVNLLQVSTSRSSLILLLVAPFQREISVHSG